MIKHIVKLTVGAVGLSLVMMGSVFASSVTLKPQDAGQPCGPVVVKAADRVATHGIVNKLNNSCTVTMKNVTAQQNYQCSGNLSPQSMVVPPNSDNSTITIMYTRTGEETNWAINFLFQGDQCCTQSANCVWDPNHINIICDYKPGSGCSTGGTSDAIAG